MYHAIQVVPSVSTCRACDGLIIMNQNQDPKDFASPEDLKAMDSEIESTSNITFYLPVG